MFKEIKASSSDKSAVKLAKGKLIVNKKTYLPGDVEDLKKDYPDANPCEKEDNERVVYFGPMSAFNNMYPSEFQTNGITYTSSEQYIQSQKAVLFNDDTTESRILAALLKQKD